MPSFGTNVWVQNLKKGGGIKMEIVRNIKVPTGNIMVGQGDKGLIEFLSIGDYGREKNVKASFLGLEREIDGVPNGEIMPLEEKWVITISSQYGCSMGCRFCDVPMVGRGRNATLKDMLGQIKAALSIHPEVAATKRLNIHYARMGEPTFNGNVLASAFKLREIVRPHVGRSLVHPVVSTMLPKKNNRLMEFLNVWTIDVKNYFYRGDAGLQFSINSTCDMQRHDMFSGNSMELSKISELGKNLIDPIGRKYALNFALADGYKVDAQKLREMFSPRKFMVKITPIHITASTEKSGIKTSGGYSEFTPYRRIERELIDAGFDVIVFIPSVEEDLGMITCGNAILSGKEPSVEYSDLPCGCRI